MKIFGMTENKQKKKHRKIINAFLMYEIMITNNNVILNNYLNKKASLFAST